MRHQSGSAGVVLLFGLVAALMFAASTWIGSCSLRRLIRRYL
ncbi:MAG: hypothetical protein ACXV5Q_10820 [Frankiaceae bacterium]